MRLPRWAPPWRAQGRKKGVCAGCLTGPSRRLRHPAVPHGCLPKFLADHFWENQRQPGDATRKVLWHTNLCAEAVMLSYGHDVLAAWCEPGLA